MICICPLIVDDMGRETN